MSSVVMRATPNPFEAFLVDRGRSHLAVAKIVTSGTRALPWRRWSGQAVTDRRRKPYRHGDGAADLGGGHQRPAVLRCRVGVVDHHRVTDRERRIDQPQLPALAVPRAQPSVLADAVMGGRKATPLAGRLARSRSSTDTTTSSPLAVTT